MKLEVNTCSNEMKTKGKGTWNISGYAMESITWNCYL